jgi:FkbM family methyltransferase
MLHRSASRGQLWIMKYFLRFSTDMRSYARITGLTRILNLFRKSGSGIYEDSFCKALLGAVRPGDCVWDVGANLGHYTAKLIDLTGDAGIVYAFEPAPACAGRLRQQFSHRVKILESALGNVETSLPLAIAENPLGSTHSLCSLSSAAVQVRVTTGDHAISFSEASQPNVIKIDVEGFELEVLEGLEHTLLNPSCRAVFVEVHFGLLDRRGDRYAPLKIESLLQEAGLRTHWIDASHLAAIRS